MQGRTKATLPGDAVGCIEPQEEIELFGEQRILIRQVIAEQRKRLREYATTGNDLGPPAREQVDRGKILEHPHRVGGGQDRHRAGQPHLVVTWAIAANTTGVAAIAKSSR